jgi:hypothetical protein
VTARVRLKSSPRGSCCDPIERPLVLVGEAPEG